MSERVASCRCGALTAVATGEPVRVSLCHCDSCKRSTGSAFSYNSTWPEAAVTVRGDYRRWERVADGGGHVRSDFCPICGATVAYRLDARPDMVSIPVGTFADKDFPPPTAEVYAECAQRGIGLTIDPPPTQE